MCHRTVTPVVAETPRAANPLGVAGLLRQNLRLHRLGQGCVIKIVAPGFRRGADAK